MMKLPAYAARFEKTCFAAFVCYIVKKYHEQNVYYNILNRKYAKFAVKNQTTVDLGTLRII